MKIAVLSKKPSLYSTDRLVKAALERDHEVRVLNHMRCYCLIEQDNPTIHYDGNELSHFDSVIPRIGASVTFYGTAVVRQFEMMNVFMLNESQAIARSRDKLRSLQLLSMAGLDLPKTAFAYHTKDVNDLIDQVGGPPCVIKLIEGTQGIGVVLAETREAAQSVIEAFYGLKARIIIQEYIEESGGADIRAFVVGDEVMGAMKRQGKEGEFRSNLHRGGRSEVIELEEDYRTTALEAVKTLGLSVAGVDMVRSNRGPMVLEVNSSPGLEGIEKTTGMDLAGKIIEYVEDKASPRMGSEIPD